MINIARILVGTGVVLMITGGIIYFLVKSGFQPGQLPGNIQFESGNTTCVLALGTSILLSILLTLFLNIFARIIK
jgi:hypothetical protein